jgi:crotonobetainyl-CoA:carnitine CoA-transferase CaiB-like acyl-CoA transferase
VRAELAAIFRTRTRDEWTATFADADCCVTPVLSFDEALADPQFVARGMVRRDASGHRSFAPPFALTPSPALRAGDAPRQGEHSREVLREAGYDDATIDALVARGVVKADE